jgi:hypothetical protein
VRVTEGADHPDAERLATLVARGEADPRAIAGSREVRDTGDALAEQVGGALALRWRIAVLRSCIGSPQDADEVRELYGEMVDRYRDDPAALRELRALGDDIRARESSGSLARTMVARSERRPKKT